MDWPREWLSRKVAQCLKELSSQSDQTICPRGGLFPGYEDQLDLLEKSGV